MNETLAKDLKFTHGLINYGLASFQGRIAYYTALDDLQFEGAPLEELERSRKACDRFAKWMPTIWKHELLFSSSWTSPSSFESEYTVEALHNLRPELNALADQIVHIFADKDTPQKPQNIKQLLAAFIRHAACQARYVEGVAEYAKVNQDTDIKEQLELAIENSRQEEKLALEMAAEYRRAPSNLGAFLGALRQNTLLLPCVFRTHVHDINQLTSSLSGGFGFAQMGASEQEAAQWTSLGFAAAQAGYWRAYGIGPAEAQVWIQQGFPGAALAGPWRFRNFSPALAREWFLAGFSALIAQPWAQAGDTPTQAKNYIEQGINHPAELKRSQPF
jgi:hypothetical protein